MGTLPTQSLWCQSSSTAWRLASAICPVANDAILADVSTHSTNWDGCPRTAGELSLLCLWQMWWVWRHVPSKLLWQSLATLVQMMMITGMALTLMGLRRLSQWLVTRKVQSRWRSCTTWITPPSNFLLCWHIRLSRQHLWSTIPDCHPWHLSNGCLVSVVWFLHR